MKRKGWFIPILVFFVCTWFLIMYEQSTNEPYLAQTSNLAQLPWDKEISDIQEIHFTSHSSSFTAKRVDDEWSITSPIQSIADSTYIYDVISKFVSPGLIHTIEIDVDDPSAYGIYDYSPTISLIDQNGAEYTLIAGNSADETTYYAYSPLTKCIYTIKKDIFDFLSTDLSKWRSKDYINFNKETISKVEFITPTKTYKLLAPTETGSSSFISEDLTPRDVDNFITFLSSSKIEQFIMDGAPSHIILSYGFDNPHMKLKIYDKAGSSKTFSFVKIPNSIYYYVLDPLNSNIYKVQLLTN